jgi:hypothetical protein
MMLAIGFTFTFTAINASICIWFLLEALNRETPLSLKKQKKQILITCYLSLVSSLLAGFITVAFLTKH